MGGFQSHEIMGWQRMDEFSERFHEIAFECSTEEAFDLPEEMDIARSTVLEPKAQKIYDSMEKHFWAGVESGEITAANALVKLLRLQQICAGWVKDDQEILNQVSTAKAELLADVLLDFHPRKALVVFVRFTKDIEVVREICEQQDRSVGEVSGQAKDLTDEGTFPEDVDVMVCQIQSGSLGINLSRASTSIFYSWGWSLGDVEQARARIRHPNQTSKLQFIHLIVEKSIDERMLACLKSRKDFIEDVLEQGRKSDG
jgi:SNF2 family DNA or RNA helicase